MIDQVRTISVVFRVLTLVLYTGGYFFYVAVLSPNLFKISPAHRLLVVSSTLRRFSYLTWIYIFLTSLAGAIYASETGMIGNSIFSSFFRTSANGIVLLVEGALTSVMLISAAVMSFILIPTLSRADLSVKVSSIDTRFKWLSVPPRFETASALSKIYALTSLNVAIGVLGILLGILVSAGRV